MYSRIVSVVVLARRWIALMLIAAWWGGFSFYSIVVVHTGHRVLQSKLKQGFITEQVTTQLNWLGAVTLAVLALDLCFDEGRRRFPICWRVSWALWSVMAAALAGLWWLHPILRNLLDFKERTVRDDDRFTEWHTAYLSVSTVQWIAGILFFCCLAIRMERWRHASPPTDVAGTISPHK